MNPKLSGWRFPLRYSIKRKRFISYGLNATLIDLVHPYNEETEGGRLLRGDGVLFLRELILAG